MAPRREPHPLRAPGRTAHARSPANSRDGRWRADPLEVLRVDLAIKDGHGREALARELIALADLVAAHPGEFRELLEREAVLTALASMR